MSSLIYYMFGCPKCYVGLCWIDHPAHCYLKILLGFEAHLSIITTEWDPRILRWDASTRQWTGLGWSNRWLGVSNSPTNFEPAVIALICRIEKLFLQTLQIPFKTCPKERLGRVRLPLRPKPTASNCFGSVEKVLKWSSWMNCPDALRLLIRWRWRIGVAWLRTGEAFSWTLVFFTPVPFWTVDLHAATNREGPSFLWSTNTWNCFFGLNYVCMLYDYVMFWLCFQIAVSFKLRQCIRLGHKVVWDDRPAPCLLSLDKRNKASWKGDMWG